VCCIEPRSLEHQGRRLKSQKSLSLLLLSVESRKIIIAGLIGGNLSLILTPRELRVVEGIQKNGQATRRIILVFFVLGGTADLFIP
jgi:hypothetical protein